MTPTTDTDWTSSFAELGDLSAAERAALREQAQAVTLPAETVVFAPGKKPDSFLLLLDGTVRVQQTAANGREIILYRVSGGESCIMTTACLLSDETYLAEGVTETTVTAIALPRAEFDRLMAQSAAFRRFIFTKYASRMVDLQKLVEGIAFERIGKRLAQKLLDLADRDGILAMTHQELAAELGTAREVVSRRLKQFADQGLVQAQRGATRITDAPGLRRIAETD